MLGAKKLLGDKSLNKIRGQAISLHSQVREPTARPPSSFLATQIPLSRAHSCFAAPSTPPNSNTGIETFRPQVITEFCVYVGCSSKTRGGLIKKAKTTGDELGFLY